MLLRSCRRAVSSYQCANLLGLFTFLSCALVSPALFAQTTYQWNGTTNSVFGTASNWDANGVAPTNGTFNARLNVQDGASANSLIYGAAQGTTIYNSATLRALFIGNGAGASGSEMQITGGTFESQAALPDGIGNGAGITGTLLINGGSYVNTNGTGAKRLNVGHDNGGVGILTIQSGSVSVNTLQFGDVAASTGTGTVNLNGGTLSVVTISDGTTVTSNFNFNGGLLKALANGTLMNPTNNSNIQAGGAFIDSNGFDVIVAEDLAGVGGLTKNGGTGTLTLTANTTYGGTTTISTGTLQIGNGGTAGSLGTGSVTNDATLTFNRSDSIAVANVISGTGAVTQAGTSASKTTLSGGNSYGGLTSVNSGILSISNSTALGGTTTGTNVANNAALELQNNIAVGTEALSITGSGVTNGGALRNLSGANSWAGTVTLGGATEFQSDAGTLTVSGDIVNGANLLTVDGAGNTTLSGKVGSGAGGITKTGAGTLILSGNNDYTGATTISAGVVNVQSSTGLGTAAGGTTVAIGAALQLQNGVTIAGEALTINDETSGGTLRNISGSNAWNGTISAVATGAANVRIGADAGTLTIGGNIQTTTTGANALVFQATGDILVTGVISNTSGSAGVIKSATGGGTLILAGNNTYAGTTAFSTGTLQIGNGGSTGTFGAGAVTDNGSLVFNRSDSAYVVTNAISGSGTVAMNGTGTIALSGGNSYAGTTTVNSGVLNIRNSTALGTSAAGTTVISGAALELQNGIAVVDETLSIGGSGVGSNGALRNISGSNSWGGTGAVTLTAPTEFQIDAGTLTISATISTTASGHTLTIDSTGNTVLSNNIGGNGGIIKNGAGKLTLSGAGSTFAGGVTINAGTVSVSDTANLGSGATPGVIINAGTLEITGGTFTGGKQVTLNNAVSNVDVTTGSATFAGKVTGAGGLNKLGAGTLNLTATNNDYAGVTTVAAGVLNISNGTALGTTAGGTTVNNTARLELQGGITVTGETINITGQGSNSMGSLQNLSGSNTWAGNVVLGNNGSNDTRIGAAAGTLTISGTISEAVSGVALNIRNDVAAGGVVLSGVGTYTGNTNVIVGTLTLSGGSNRLPTGTTLVIGNGGDVNSAKFDLNGQNQEVAGLGTLGTTMTRTITSTAAATLTVNNNTASSFNSTNASIGGAISLVKEGTGTLTLGANGYTGNTTINNGTLSISTSNGTGVGANIIFGGGTLQTTATLSTSKNVTLSGAGTFDVTTGTATFSGNVTGSGPLNKESAGTLVLSGTNSYSGATNVNGGVLNLQSNTALGNTTGATTVANGARLELQGVTVTGETLTINGTGGNTFGALQAASGTNVWAGTVNLGTNTPTVGANAGSLNIGGTIQNGAGSTVNVVNNTGTTIFSGNNTYTGLTTVSAGVLRVSNANGLGTSAAGTTVTSGARVELAGGTTVANEAITINGGGSNNFGALQSQSGTNTWNGTVTLGDAAARLGAQASQTLIVGGVIQNGGGSTLTISGENGTGTVVIAGTSNTYSGITGIVRGVLKLGANNALPTTTTLDVDTVNANEDSTFDLGGFSQTVANLQRTDDTTGGGTNLGKSIITNSGVSAGTLTINNSVTNTYNGNFVSTGGAGALNISKTNTGTLNLGGDDSSFAGTFTINSASSVFFTSGTADSASANWVLNASGAVLASNIGVGNTLDLGSLAGVAGSTLRSGGSGPGTNTYSIGALGTDTTFAGNITDGPGNFTAITKTGTGKLTLTGNNTYTGVTTVSNGTLNIQSATALGNTTGVTNVGGNGRLELEHATGITVAGEVLNTPLLVNVSGNNSWTGNIQAINGNVITFTSNAGTLTVNNVNATSPDAQAHTFTMNGAGDGEITGVLSGALSVNKSGAGTWILSGTNTYAATTVISAGTLQVGNGGATGTLGNGTGAVTNNSALVFNRNNAYTVTNVINGSGTVTQNGSGSVTLNQANGYTGQTFVNSGELVVANNSALGTAAGGTAVANGARVVLANGITVASEAITIDGDGGNFAGALQADANATAAWNGAVILNGANARIGTQAGAASQLTVGGPIQNGTGSNLFISAGTTGGAAGTVIISSTSNTYTGATNIIRGTVKIGANNALPTGTTLDVDSSTANQDATFDLNNFDQTVGVLQRSGTGSGAGGSFVTNSSGAVHTFTVNQAINTSYDGLITGNLALTKSNTGTLTLLGANSYAGATNVTGGTLQLDAGGTMSGTSGVNVGTAAGSGTLLITSNVSHTLGAAGADVSLGSGGNQGTLNFQANSPVKVTLPDDMRVGDTISGSVGIVNHTGSGELEVTGAATIANGAGTSGQYNISAGVFNPNGAGGLVVGASGGTSGNRALLNVTGTGHVAGSSTNNLTVGQNAGSFGRVSLGAGATPAVDSFFDIFYGVDGNGDLQMSNSAATHTSARDTVLGANAGGVGTGTMSGGTLTTGRDLVVGASSTQANKFTQNGGTVSVTRNLTVGQNAGSNGTYELNGGTVTAPDVKLADAAGSTALFTHTGGTLNVTATSTYSVGAGGGSAIVNQSGGTTNVTGGMIIGNGSGPATENQYNLSGGVLDFGDSAGRTQHWGAGTAPSAMTINSDGQFNFTGGTLRDVTSINANGGVGTFTQGGGAFYIGQDESAGGYAFQTTIHGGFSLLSGTVYFDAFGADPTPEQCCDGVASLNDQLTVEGTALLNSALSLDFEGYEPQFGDIYTLICAENIVLDDGFFIDGGYFRVVPTGNEDFPFALQAIVPEPASLAVWSVLGVVVIAGGWKLSRRNGQLKKTALSV